MAAADHTAEPSRAPCPVQCGLPRSARLLNKPQFDAVLRQGKRQRGYQGFAASVLGTGLDEARLGLTTAKKMLPHAVQRNSFKRQCRESFRLARARLPGVDVVIAVRPEARTMPSPALRRELERLWQNLSRHRETPPPR